MTQQAVKKASAMSKRRGPMKMGGLLVGIKVPNAKAPTRVMLMPASMMHSPQAQHRAGEGMLWCLGACCSGVFLGADELEFFSGSTMSQESSEKLLIRQMAENRSFDLFRKRLKSNMTHFKDFSFF